MRRPNQAAPGRRGAEAPSRVALAAGDRFVRALEARGRGMELSARRGVALGHAIAALVLVAALCMLPSTAAALPHMSLLAGAPCATCHVNETGGGMRTNIGWGSMAYSGAVQWEDIGVGWLSDRASNEVVDYLVSVGMDTRLQMARIGAPEITVDDDGGISAEPAPREIFLMQLQPYLAVTPHEMLTLYGTWNVGRNTFMEGDFCDTPYPGQQCFEAMGILHLKGGLPGLRAGMIQPSMGIRHDDHTMLIRQDAVRSRVPIIPPNYAEWGAEAFWQPRFWFRSEVGVFSAMALSDAVADESIVAPEDVALLARAQFLPQFGPRSGQRYTSWIGGSVYAAGDFRMDNLFVGLGMMDRAALILESAFMHYGADVRRHGRNLSAQATVQTWEWLMLQARVENAWARVDSTTANTLAVVSGVHFYPIPWVEIRPEYRWQDSDRFRSGQYTVQLHLFY